MENTKELMYKKNMSSTIQSIAVLGSGTMGSGIAALCLEKGYKVLLLDISVEAVSKAKSMILNEKYKMLSTTDKIEKLEIGTFENNFNKISDYDWICEAVVEKVEIKRDIFKKIEEYRKDGSVVSSNTSGIPLRDIIKDMPNRMLEDVCITHFFNPVKIMKLCELVPSIKTKQNVLMNLRLFLENSLEKGVVDAKDTVNFIGNRIGCYWMLRGVHERGKNIYSDLTIEEIDTAISKPMGIPPTGLFGLIDLIGLDVMHSVGKNLSINLPQNDLGRPFTDLPNEESIMFKNNQLGRKSGGGYYRVKKISDDQKVKEVYNLTSREWREFKEVKNIYTINSMLENSNMGKFLWNVMGSTLLYACDLIPEISDDILNVDRAMKWGFGWRKGPFEMIDMLEATNVIDMCQKNDIKIPRMLNILKNSGKKHFYNQDSFLDIEGEYKKI